MRTATLVRYSHILSQVSFTLILLNVLVAFLYAIFLLGTVTHAASRQNAISKIHDLSLHVENLEAQYLSKNQSITPQTAVQLGFIQPTAVATVYVDSGLHALSLRNQ